MSCHRFIALNQNLHRSQLDTPEAKLHRQARSFYDVHRAKLASKSLARELAGNPTSATNKSLSRPPDKRGRRGSGGFPSSIFDEEMKGPDSGFKSTTMALIIGIEYIQYEKSGELDRLPGCINDTKTMHNLLSKRLAVPDSNITIMTDNLSTDSSNYPSVKNIKAALAKLVQLAIQSKVKTLWIAYSGHGSRVNATNAGEPDNKNSVIVPADFLDSGFITDNYIATEILAKLPKDVNVNIVFDSCNSGTATDLPYTFASSTSKAIKENNNKILANVCYLSGCRDDETSESTLTVEGPVGGGTPGRATTVLDNGDSGPRSVVFTPRLAHRSIHPTTGEVIWRGALTYAFEYVLLSAGITPNVKIGLDILLEAIQVFLKHKGYSQDPEISLSRDVSLKSVEFPLGG